MSGGRRGDPEQPDSALGRDLTQQVASGDVPRERGVSSTAYYMQHGNPTGQWVGSGLEQLAASGQVAKKQMQSMFGKGRHPDADRLEVEALACGLSKRDAAREGALVRAFPKFKDRPDDGYRQALEAAFGLLLMGEVRAPPLDRPIGAGSLWVAAGTFRAGRRAMGVLEGERTRVNLYVHFMDGDSRTFVSIGGDVYRYSISGGALIVLCTRKGEPISNSEIVVAYSPSQWATVDGLAFGNLGIEGLGEPAARYDVADSVL